VADRHQFGKIGRDYRDAPASRREITEQFIDFSFSADIGAARRLVEDQCLGPPEQPFQSFSM
jgi:hypothetical protein